MPETQELLYFMRIGVMTFVLPIWLLATGLFLLNGDYLYVVLMLAFGATMGYGVYKNFDRIRRNDTVDDERMTHVNRKAGSTAFWMMINTGILILILGDFLKARIPGLVQYDALGLIGLGFISYLGFRLYYLRYGTEADFWNLR